MPPLLRRAVPAGGVCLALGLSFSACSVNVSKIGDQSGTKDGKAAIAVVKRFSASSGADACRLLTPNALRDVYGGEQANGTPPLPSRGRRRPTRSRTASTPPRSSKASRSGSTRSR